MNVAIEMENFIESFSSVGYSFITVAIIPLLFLVFTPLLFCVAKGEWKKGIDLTGLVVLGYVACAGIIFAPIGFKLIIDAYSGALKE